jgi:hypothetical protein
MNVLIKVRSPLSTFVSEMARVQKNCVSTRIYSNIKQTSSITIKILNYLVFMTVFPFDPTVHIFCSCSSHIKSY